MLSAIVLSRLATRFASGLTTAAWQVGLLLRSVGQRLR